MASMYQNEVWHVSGFNESTAKDGKQIDYIFIFGEFNPNGTNTSNFSDLKENLKDLYTLIFTSADKWIHIYKNHSSK